jgi:cell division transport system permease protein
MTTATDRAGVRSPDLLLPGLGGGPAPWVVAVMSALALLALALAASLSPAAQSLGRQIAGRATVQIVEGDPISRRDAVAAARRVLEDAPYVSAVHIVPEVELNAMAERWLGEGVRDTGLPLPALIDVDLIGGGSAQTLARLRRDMTADVAGARVVAHADWLGPVGTLFRSLAWIALLLAVLLLAASGAVAVLTVRATLSAQRGTIDILHLVGATDSQIARLFQRQVARDMGAGVALGAIVAFVVALVIGWQLQGITAGLLQDAGSRWTLLGLVLVAPLFVLLTVLTTRWTVLRALKAMP